MKYMLCIVGLVCLIAGCANNQTPASGTGTEALKTTAVTTEQHERLKVQVDGWTEELPRFIGELHDLQEYLERDPNYLLYLMDRDLDAVERGENTRGSFSDYFVPNAVKALAAGATKKDIMTRIDRVIALAEKEIYLSGYVAQLMKEGGPAAVRSYADEWIRESQKQ